MTYNTLTNQEKERIFAEDVLGWKINDGRGFGPYYEGWGRMKDFSSLTNLDHTMLGVEKIDLSFSLHRHASDIRKRQGYHNYNLNVYDETGYLFSIDNDSLNATIVEACIRIKRPDSFEEQS